MSALEQDKGFDRWSTILGQPCRILNPVGTPKAKKDCQPFTFEMYDQPRDFLQPSPRYGHTWRSNLKRIEAADGKRKPVEKMIANGTHLKARCNRCSKVGKNCQESKSAAIRQACIIRQCGGSKR